MLVRESFHPILWLKALAIIAILAWGVFPFTAISQEKEVSVDHEGKIFVIDATLREQAGLFSEYAGFKEARLFEINDKEFSIEIYYKPDERVLRKRMAMTPDEVQTLRNKISEIRKAKPEESALDQSGRVKLLVTSTVAGLGYYGWAIPVALHMKSGKAVASSYMLISALSFYVPFAATRDVTVTEAGGNAYVYGTTRGALHGMLLNSVVFGNDYSYRRAFGFSVAGSIGEAVAFYKLASTYEWSTGKVELLGAGGDFGMIIGWAVPFAFDYEGKNRAYAGSVIAGAGAGFIAGHYLSGTQHYTQGDAFVFRSAGAMGAYTSISAINLIQPKNERWYARAIIAGSLSGLYLGNILVKDKDFTPAQGTFIEIGQLAGWLTGLGIAYLIQDPEKTNNGRVYSSLSAIGGIAGYTLMYRSFAAKAQGKTSQSSWNIHLMPQNFILSKFTSSRNDFSVPLAAIDVRF